jgi:hypothetical protein
VGDAATSDLEPTRPHPRHRAVHSGLYACGTATIPRRVARGLPLPPLEEDLAALYGIASPARGARDRA